MLVHYKKENLVGVCGASGANKLILKPGIQEVDDELWKEAHSNGAEGKPLYPYFHELKKQGHIVELKSADAKKSAQAEDFHSMDEDTAIEMANNTADIDLLQSWANKDKRKKVLAALKAQIKKYEDA